MHSVIIIGSGPAGHTAAVYAARANLKPLCIEGVVKGGVAGGQLMITSDVENYPGFAESIAGPELMERFKQQAARFGTEQVSADVERVDFSRHPFKVWTDEHEYEGKSIIIATGASARWLGIPNEQQLQNHGVSACATCDGYFFRNMDVAVVGGGDTAMEEALYLAGLCKSVTVVHRRRELRASKIMAKRALEHPKIRFEWDSAVVDIKDVSKGEVSSIVLEDLPSGKRREVAVKGLFIAIGHTPNTQIFGNQITLDENGYIVTKPGTTRTNIEGVFAAGDVQDHVYRQAVTAAGTGCMAAIEAERWLAARE
ncbi:MAG: thioredoxin-disulfide reductase [Polyangiales bacterium]